jgi:hypothetical protein
MVTVPSIRAHYALHSASLGVLNILLDQVVVNVVLILSLHFNSIFLISLLLLDALTHLHLLLLHLNWVAIIVQEGVWVLLRVRTHSFD